MKAPLLAGDLPCIRFAIVKCSLVTNYYWLLILIRVTQTFSEINIMAIVLIFTTKYV